MSDIVERLEEEILHASSKSFDSQQAGMNANFLIEVQDEITRLRAENKKLREALKPFAALGRLAKKLDDNTPCKTTIMSGHLRAAAAALEGVTEPPL